MTKAEYASFIYRIMYDTQTVEFEEVLRDNPHLFACTVSYFDDHIEVSKSTPWNARRYTFDDGSSVTDNSFSLVLSYP